MTKKLTKLDRLKELADGSDHDEKSRFCFYEALIDTELYLLLEKELEGGVVCPKLIETSDDKYAVVFDTISRLVEFTGYSSPYLALTGRMALPILKEQKLGLGLNLNLAVLSEILLGSSDIDWLQNIVEQFPEKLNEKITKFSEPSIPVSVRDLLHKKLKYLSEFVAEVWSAEAVYESGHKSQIIAFVDVNAQMHGAIAKAVNEALTFISEESSSIDVIFLKSESLDIKKIRQVGVSFNFKKDRKEQITLSDTVITPRQNLKPPRLR